MVNIFSYSGNLYKPLQRFKVRHFIYLSFKERYIQPPSLQREKSALLQCLTLRENHWVEDYQVFNVSASTHVSQGIFKSKGMCFSTQVQCFDFKMLLLFRTSILKMIVVCPYDPGHHNKLLIIVRIKKSKKVVIF